MQTPHIHLCNLHASYPAFNDTILGLDATLQELGFKTSIDNVLNTHQQTINIVFGAHKMRLEDALLKNKHLITYNLEQINTDVPWMRQPYFHFMKHTQVWDYHAHNVQKLQQSGIKHARLMPIAYNKFLEDMPKSQADLPKDIDILFYGLLNQRRIDMINQLINAGLKVVCTSNGPWSLDERNALIERSKIVLNLHYYETQPIFEMARCIVPISKHTTVISERLAQSIIEPHLENCAIWTPPEALVQTCLNWLNATPQAHEIQQTQALKAIQAVPLKPLLEENLTHYLQTNYTSKANKTSISKTTDLTEVTEVTEVTEQNSKDLTHVPKKMQIGSGKSWKFDQFNIDIDARWKPDYVFDLNQAFPFEQPIQTWRFGEITLPKGHFNYILSEHVFEHVHNLVNAMQTCLDLLSDGGILEVEVPYDLSYGAWQDPTHVRAFNENSWLYYTEWYWYLGWENWRFDMIAHNFILNDYGHQLLAENNNNFEAIRRVPRTIDSFRVQLRKRAVTQEEKQKYAYLYPNDGFASDITNNTNANQANIEKDIEALV